MKAKLSGKKAYIVAGLMVIVAVINLVSGDLGLMEFLTNPDLMLLLEGLGIGFLRAGISKGQT